MNRQEIKTELARRKALAKLRRNKAHVRSVWAGILIIVGWAILVLLKTKGIL